VNTKMVSYLAG